MFEGVPGAWLRWCGGEGNWLLTDTKQEQLEKEQERTAKEQAQAQLIQAAQNFLATEMEINQVTTLLGLSDEQVQALRDSKV